MANLGAIIGMGADVAGGITKAAGSKVAAAGQQLSIQGQILATMGKAFQYDVQSQEYTQKSQEETYQADVERINQEISKQNANWARDSGEVEASAEGMQDRYAVGAAKAAQGSSGIDVNSASSFRTRESMIEVGQYNQAMIRSNAAHIAYGYDVQATQHEAQAAIHVMQSDLDKAQAANASTAANITREGIPLEQTAYGLAGTAGELGADAAYISAAGSVAAKWQQASFLGMVPSGASPG